ncbi:M28 family peptidase [Chryseobacterium sp.]|uniref:M28 family peptidase n=1 Tax=Chryseobacterium sp. TaxID=1871047 RepID=UPI001E310E77|nr:M28 family peptidase [Chryseobacterium sp.]
MDWQTAAPGANDDGSGVAAVIESARIYLPVKHRQLYHFPKTISCLLFRAFLNQAILACL